MCPLAENVRLHAELYAPGGNPSSLAGKLLAAIVAEHDAPIPRTADAAALRRIPRVGPARARELQDALRRLAP